MTAPEEIAPPHACLPFIQAMSAAEVPLGYSDRFREHVLRMGEAEGTTTAMLILFCPFCGEKLPASVRPEYDWELQKRGLTPDGDLPADLHSGAWWRAQGL